MGPISSVQVSVGCWDVLPPVKLLTSCSAVRLPEADGVSESNDKSEQLRQILTNDADGINELGDCFLNIGRNFSTSSPPPPPAEKRAAWRHTSWKQRRVCSYQGGTLAVCEDQKEAAARMTKLRSQPLSPDSHERWEIVAAQAAVSAGQSSNANNGVCGAAVQLTRGIKISCNNAKERN